MKFIELPRTEETVLKWPEDTRKNFTLDEIAERVAELALEKVMAQLEQKDN